MVWAASYSSTSLPAVGCTASGFTAEVLPDNHGMLGVFDDAGFALTRSLPCST
jgi:hypothetical protein